MKEIEIANELLAHPKNFAEFIFIFGGKDKVKKKLPDFCFQSLFSLEELEGNSSEVKEKKQRLWKELKNWKGHTSLV